MDRARLVVLLAGTLAASGGGYALGRWRAQRAAGPAATARPAGGGEAGAGAAAGGSATEAGALVARGRYAEAARVLEGAMESHPKDPDLPCRLARLRVLELSEEAARAAAARAAAIDPDRVETLKTQAVVLIEFLRYEEAAPIVERLWRLAPGDPFTSYASGVVRLYRGECREAEADLRRVLGHAQHGPDALYELGIALARLDRPREGANCFLELLEEDPHDLKACFQLAALLRKLDRPEGLREAEAHFRFLEKSEPLFEKARNFAARGALLEAALNRARGHRSRGQYREAEAELRAEASGSPAAARELADLLLLTGRRREGLEVLRSLGGVEAPARPSDPPAPIPELGWPEASPALVEWAREALMAGDRGEARRRIHLAVCADPRSLSGLRLWAALLEGPGQSIPRLSALRRLASLGDSRALAERADIRARLGG